MQLEKMTEYIKENDSFDVQSHMAWLFLSTMSIFSFHEKYVCINGAPPCYLL